MVVPYLIIWGCNQFLEQLIWIIKKFKQFNQHNIVSDITALTFMASVNELLKKIPLHDYLLLPPKIPVHQMTVKERFNWILNLTKLRERTRNIKQNLTCF